MEEDIIVHNDVVYTREEFNDFLGKQAAKGSLFYLRYVGFGGVSLIKGIFKCASFIKTNIKSYFKKNNEKLLEGLPDEWDENEIVYLISSNLDVLYKSYQIFFDMPQVFDNPDDLIFFLKKVDSVSKYLGKDKIHLKTSEWIDYQYQNTLIYWNSLFNHDNNSNSQSQADQPSQPITLYIFEPCDLRLTCCANITNGSGTIYAAPVIGLDALHETHFLDLS